MILILLIPLLLSFLVYLIIRDNKKRYKDTIKYDAEVFTKNDLFEYHLNNEVWVGMKIKLKCYDAMYILTSIDFYNSDPWDLWKPYRELSNSFGYKYGPENYCFLSNSGRPILEENKNVFFCIAEGNNFQHKNIKDGDVLGIDPACFPRLYDIVADTELVLWEVIKKQGGIYELSRKDGRHRFAKDENIFGVVRYSWTIK